MADDRYPGDDHERIILEAERLEQKRIQVLDDVSSIDVNVEQLCESSATMLRQQEYANAEIVDRLNRLSGQNTITNILLALILGVIAYKLFW